MSANKTLERKLRLGKKIRMNKNIPRWVILKDKLKKRWNYKRHHWRRSHLKL
ncbi:Ribosomal protein L39 [Giardia muris]|uniref:Ribosomal protein L39 n=1 Tax=Giardia muris TaxID=5742 RepID=A0A4Z1T1N8_GIAMU|nr:Ribosomal protein L39 [Giardia muris]8FRU_l Chain l, 60S ribosomal protein eL39 [Giardia intestinalis assemblage A]|eukprot:TNJ27843.1 Ribosomal protein L39 [Giardia muris]